MIAEDRLAINPHGGQLGEAYIHGMNEIAEAVRQVRGTAVHQVPGNPGTGHGRHRRPDQRPDPQRSVTAVTSSPF
ncbi:hypothetical protein Asi03nite_44230 [Actinoplanes siamensis]|uniref:Uncharacterized protein n=1 Tax=Actinoplanes siamensis TaxID=1223317 RepID=A0A919N9T7_9ACTN|nr:hypothetical protein Asi03nite_44230 [Actinoplanes siamensis]